MKNKESKNKNGFSLLELLVVILIIGILAAIALPQYKLAVGKARFATLKNITRSLQQAAQRYYLANNAYPHSLSGLDIGLDIKKEKDQSWGLELTMSDDMICTIWTNTTDYVACNRKIFGKLMHYYVGRETGRPWLCFVSDNDPKGLPSRLCANETNKPVKSSCAETTCSYNY